LTHIILGATGGLFASAPADKLPVAPDIQYDKALASQNNII
jgi:hypothetical protein